MDNLYYNRKKLKKIQNKRTGKTKKIWGWILTALGAITFLGSLPYTTMSDVTDALIFMVPGLLLLILTTLQVKKWDRYDAIIDNHGNTSIPLIAERMGLSEKTVYSDLQKMIQNDFFIGPNCDIQAHVDAERELLVMCSGGKPLKPLPKAPAQAKPAEEKKEEPKPYPKQEAPKKEPEKKEQTQAKMSDLDMIRKAIAETPDDEVRGYLYGLEGSLRRIDERLENDDELREKTSIRRLYKYYLPQIMELIRRYQSPDTPVETKNQIRDALRTSADALSNIEADILERDQMDVEINIEALKNMFAQDGLTGREQGFSGAKAGGSAQAAAQAGSQSQEMQQQGGGR